jgi:purine-binding chemotaxis protein CheW
MISGDVMGAAQGNLTEEELKSRAAELSASPKSSEGQGNFGLINMTFGEECYGLPLSCVQEVVSKPHLTWVPMTPSFINGLMNLRGDIVPVIDLSLLLGTRARKNRGPSPESLDPNFVVVVAVLFNEEQIKLGLMSEGVTDVSWFQEADCEAIPPTFPMAVAEFFQGTYRLDGRLIAVIKIKNVLNHPELRKIREDL